VWAGRRKTGTAYGFTARIAAKLPALAMHDDGFSGSM